MGNLIEQADRAASIFVRVSRADFSGYVSCYTCGVRIHWKEAQCGHFKGRGAMSVRYFPDNMRPQCNYCNVEMGGRPDIFEECLREEIGDEAVDELIAESRQMVQLSDNDLRQLIAFFRGEAKKYGII